MVIVDLQDILSLELPDIFKLLPNVDFVHDFGAVETTRPTTQELSQPITTLARQATSVPETCGLIRAYALMLKHDLHDLPVVSESGHLVGIASRVDLGTAILSLWKEPGDRGGMIEVLVAAAIFLACLGLIFSEKVNRTIAAFAGAVVMVGAGKIFNFYNETEAIAAIDFNTLGLLLGMMVLVALLEPTGFFQYLAVWAARLSRGQPVRLLILLGSVTTVLSMFLDNVTTVVLIAPVTILICEILGVSALPYLMAEALLSDTGGVATLVGDPPNVLISSVAGFTFNDFLTHSLPMVLVAWLAALLLIRYLFRKELSIPPTNPDAIQLLDLERDAARPDDDPAGAHRSGCGFAGPLYSRLAAGQPGLYRPNGCSSSLDLAEARARLDLAASGMECTGVFRHPVHHCRRPGSCRGSGWPGFTARARREYVSDLIWGDLNLVSSWYIGHRG